MLSLYNQTELGIAELTECQTWYKAEGKFYSTLDWTEQELRGFGISFFSKVTGYGVRLVIPGKLESIQWKVFPVASWAEHHLRQLHMGGSL